MVWGRAEAMKLRVVHMKDETGEDDGAGQVWVYRQQPVILPSNEKLSMEIKFGEKVLFPGDWVKVHRPGLYDYIGVIEDHSFNHQAGLRIFRIRLEGPDREMHRRGVTVESVRGQYVETSRNRLSKMTDLEILGAQAQWGDDD